jgi:dipeptidyl-peptidase-4
MSIPIRARRPRVPPCPVTTFAGASAWPLRLGQWRRLGAALGQASLLALLLATATLPAAAQQRRLTLDDLYDPQKKLNFTGNPPTDLVWLDETHYLWPRSEGEGRPVEWLKVEATTGRTEPWFDQARMEAAFARLPGISAEEARRLARQRRYVTNPRRTAVVVSVAGDLYYYEFGADRARRLTFSPEEEEEVSFSPDGTHVAFVRAYNLYLVDLDTGTERPLTTDGHAQRFNGKLDWVYQEEIYGRGNFRAYWWSPDSSRIAYLQLDETPVPEFTVIDHLPYRLGVETWDYPKAGDPNPIARLGVVRIAGGPTVWIDTSEYAPVQFLIVNVDWTPDGRAVVHQIQDREQTWLDLRLADPTSGEPRRVLRETTKAWVNENGNPRWLKDGTFLWFSERTGWKHLYHYRPDGTLIRQITNGPWEVRTLHGVDEESGWVYFSGTERSHIGLDVYRIRLDGTGLTRLSERAGTHTATFNPPLTLYLDTWSDVTTPPQVRLHRADGREVRVIDENRVDLLAEFRLSRPEFHQVKTRDGFVMEAMLIKPPDFDPTRKYPVYQHTYGGPHAPQVRNAWGGTTYMFHQLLAQHGILVWICDNRTASGKGAQSVWPLYRRFGELELSDIEDGLAWLKQHPFVDPARIGINGWSYGGFMVTYALTHSRSFAMGIAGGSVTDWRDYDSIYTERYMQMPQNNPEGYRHSSPRFVARNLHGQLLLIHGTMDDNVHLQNTLQFAYELQRAGKRFELMLYPRSRHGITEPELVKHLRMTMLEFILRTLQPERQSARPTASSR